MFPSITAKEAVPSAPLGSYFVCPVRQAEKGITSPQRVLSQDEYPHFFQSFLKASSCLGHCPLDKLV